MKCFQLFLLVIFTCCSNTTWASVGNIDTTDLPTFEEYKKIKKRQCWITLNDGTLEKGVLYEVSDDEVTLLPSQIPDYSVFLDAVENKPRVFKKSNIKRISTQIYRWLPNSLLIGTGSGLIAGLPLIHTDTSAGFGAGIVVAVGLAFVILGVLLGLWIGVIKRNYSLRSAKAWMKLKEKSIVSQNKEKRSKLNRK